MLFVCLCIKLQMHLRGELGASNFEPIVGSAAVWILVLETGFDDRHKYRTAGGL